MKAGCRFGFPTRLTTLNEMMFLLDTNVVSDLMRREPRVENRVRSITAADRIAVSTIVRGELLYGIERLPDGKRKTQLRAEADDVLGAVPSESLPDGAADVYATLKASCERRGAALDENDLWLAATALFFDATLVTRDRDFQGVAGLRLDDWSVSP